MNLKKAVLMICMLVMTAGFIQLDAATVKAETAVQDGQQATQETGENTENQQAGNGTEAKKAEKKAKKKKKKKKKYTKKELRLMTAIIFAEAGNQSYAGKLAVGIVVMNRKKSSSFPNTVKGVIYQNNQFSPVKNGALKSALDKYDKGYFQKKEYKQCYKAAKAALNGEKYVKLKGKKKKFTRYLFFSQSLPGAKITLGDHQFK